MAMEITNNYSNYTTSSTNTTKNISSAKDSNVNDYSKYLQGKYSYMNTGTTSMQGVPTTVSVSSAFLKKCMNDPDGKIAKEKKAQEEKAAKRRAEKKVAKKAEQKVFHRDTLEISQLLNNKENAMDRVKHAVMKSATVVIQGLKFRPLLSRS